jgi:hypothetical protein
LLATVDGKQYVVGTLTGGPDIDEENDALVCRTNNLIASYGRFTAAFPDLQAFLTATDGGSRTSPASGTPSITATPLTSTAASGVTTLSWQAPGYSRVQVRVGSPDGIPMTGLEGPTGSAQTGPWATAGMTFYLQDASDGDSSGSSKTLATVRLQTTAGSTQKAGVIALSPSRIIATGGQTTGSVTVAWQSIGVSRAQIRVGSPNGTALTGFESPNGSASTGNWVSNGTTFYLQDASDGDSSGSARTLAAVTAQVIVR